MAISTPVNITLKQHLIYWKRYQNKDWDGDDCYWQAIHLESDVSSKIKPDLFETDHIYQPIRSGRIWHKVNF